MEGNRVTAAPFEYRGNLYEVVAVNDCLATAVLELAGRTKGASVAEIIDITRDILVLTTKPAVAGGRPIDHVISCSADPSPEEVRGMIALTRLVLDVFAESRGRLRASGMSGRRCRWQPVLRSSRVCGR